MEQREYLGTEKDPAIIPRSDEKTLALLAHVLTFISTILAPLVIYLIKKDESNFVAEHAKESLNFQITVIIIIVVLFITVIGAVLVWLVGLLASVLVIIATIKASEGKLYRYPINFRLIK